MAPRPRSKSRQGWPANLYPNREGFKYRHPVTKRETWMGTDKTRAFAAAKKLNALLMPTNDLVDRVIGSKETVADAIAVFRRDDIPGRKWAPKTAEVYESVIRRIETGIGARPVEQITVKDCAEFIRAVTQSTRSRQQFRLVLGWILACAIEEGWMDSNPALATRKFTHERQRDRLSVDTYLAIRAVATPWLQHAMDLSLMTLLRREDIVNLRYCDIRDGAIWVIPTKTERTSGIRIRISMTPSLEELIGRTKDSVSSPYVVHRLPEKARPANMRAKERSHHTQVLPEQLTRAFQDARMASGLVSCNPPSFHEIRSLGAALLQQSGRSIVEVQALLGHTDEETTKIYLDGHEPVWTSATSGTAIDGVFGVSARSGTPTATTEKSKSKAPTAEQSLPGSKNSPLRESP
ncbi:tyrosine-type recombinase/integrase [Stenotrophomonas sp. TWI587]|uniref:tyrosine-type recombinase/integrase n=1 Tax=Stenotrophomonas sp. TWI587 TaxID=3136783 RepID=UPI0032083B61